MLNLQGCSSFVFFAFIPLVRQVSTANLEDRGLFHLTEVLAQGAQMPEWLSIPGSLEAVPQCTEMWGSNGTVVGGTRFKIKDCKDPRCGSVRGFNQEPTQHRIYILNINYYKCSVKDCI